MAANEAKRTFLANMSHELRSPLNVVLGFTQLLMNRTELPHDARQDLTAIYNSGQYLYTLINQVLDLSKIETGNLTLNETYFDLYALMDELADMFILPAKQKGLHLLIENDPNVPQYLHADALKLRQVLINLLNNAIKLVASRPSMTGIRASRPPKKGKLPSLLRTRRAASVISAGKSWTMDATTSCASHFARRSCST